MKKKNPSHNILIIALIILVVMSALGLYMISTIKSKSPTKSPLPITLKNQGSDMEGHTPRGFQGQGTGLFAGDNLNSNFPNGDGVQIFLTFDLSSVPKTINKATLKVSNQNLHFSGTPFKDLGNLIGEEIRFEEFSSELFNLDPVHNGAICIFATDSSDPFECDLTQAAQNSLSDGYPYVQFRLRFEKASDSDNIQDMVMFYTKNSNTNQPGIFELKIS